MSGILDVSVVRVTTLDASLPNKDIAEISADFFGTAGSGDSINLKCLVEDCSNNVATVNPGIGTGTACDDVDAIFDVPRNDLGITYNCDFFNDYGIDAPGDLCIHYSEDPQVDDRIR